MLLSFAPLAALAAPEDPSKLARVELVADVATVEPGSTFWVGLRFELEPRWHVYWRNPGESGLATRVAFHAPEGFEVGPTLFPAPRREVLPGDITCFVYDDEVVFLARVQAPAELEPGTALAFGAQASWLVCQEACYFQQGEFDLRLEAGDGKPGPGAQAIERSAARLPRPFADAGASAAWTVGAESVLAIEVAEASELDFFPLRVEGVELAGSTDSRTADGARIELRFRTEDPAALRAEGVLAARRGEEWAYFQVDSRPSERAGG